MADDTESGVKRLEVKKYPNRRYYDATHSRHFTLEEIRSLIQQGYDLRVIDAKTSADITAQVLTQIILEFDTPKLDSLPVPLLLRLIRMNDQLIKDFIEKYFNQALKSFFDYQQHLEEQLRRTHGLPPAFASVSAWTRAMLAPFASAFTPQNSDNPPGSQETEASGGQKQGQELNAQIRDLQQQVAELKRAHSKRRARTRRRKG
ncbi:MAG TPA: polyhydroxyalkanoate synthesis regulator DNA-binding domain-containing protein [Verrucomicrobiae bacterium]|nr:polyhydroxyalkanoate synthesis regulator DNA-binding domain-containing protein [Verrucomicrobiae bacterium]